MGKVNADWHNANPMPKNPTLAQRVAWHRAHAAHCACRGMPETIRKLIEAEDARDGKAGD